MKAKTTVTPIIGKLRKQPAVDMATLQSNLEGSASEFRSAQQNFLKASDRLNAAQTANEQAIISFNQGLATVKSSAYVPSLLAK